MCVKLCVKEQHAGRSRNNGRCCAHGEARIRRPTGGATATANNATANDSPPFSSALPTSAAADRVPSDGASAAVSTWVSCVGSASTPVVLVDVFVDVRCGVLRHGGNRVHFKGAAPPAQRRAIAKGGDDEVSFTIGEQAGKTGLLTDPTEFDLEAMRSHGGVKLL